jgi:uncharacterized tellurite resistance protein B-like protein
MHIVVIVLGVLGAATFWWYRLKMMGDAANEVVDQVGRVQGHFRRQKLRKKAAVAPVAAIDDPVIAAATLMTAIAAEDAVVSDALKDRVRDVVTGIASSAEKAEEAVTYAVWASNQVAEVQTVIDQTATFLKDKLNNDEKEELVGMVQSVVLKDERHAMYAQRIDRLRRKLGLVVSQ